ncbi:MAG: hypothetical protein ACR2K3_03275 [Nocardioides sp.]
MVRRTISWVCRCRPSRRLTLVIKDGRVEHVIYPVFPPDQAATDVLAILRR